MVYLKKCLQGVNLKKTDFIKVLLFILIGTSAILLYFKSPVFIEKIALAISDSKFVMRKVLGMSKSANRNIVIVEVGEKSINKLGRWPWNRKTIGNLVSKLNQGSIVALDIVFSEKSTPEADKYLAEKISENGNVIGGFFFRSEATEKIDNYIINYLYDQAIFRIKMLSESTNVKQFPYVEANIPQITDALMANAFFTIEPDSDGLYRKYPLAYLYKGMLIPSIASQTLRYHLNRDISVTIDKKGLKDFNIGKINIKNSNKILLNYYDNATFISAYDVIAGHVDESFFNNKIVLVGVTETGIYDLRPTPVDPVTPGVLLHLTAINNLMENEYLRDNYQANIIMIISSLLIILLFSFLRKIHIRIIVYIIVVLAFYALSNYLFINNNIWLRDFYYLMPAAVLAFILEMFAFFIVNKKSMEMKKAFSTYVSPEIVDIMMHDPEKLSLGGEDREVTVMFTDIRGFTTISENLTSEKVVSILNRLNSPLTESIIRHKGLLDKYIGDAIMAVFNAPVDIENHADLACETALEMRDILEETNEGFRKDDLPPIDIGIGLNTGIATVGNIGSSLRFDYTAIGDSVNLASRLEGLNKIYKTHIILSSFTKDNLKKIFLLRRLDKVTVKGKKEPVEIFELLKNTDKNRKIAEKFNEAMTDYFQENFNAARELFQFLQEKYSDKTSEVYAERCLSLIKNGVPANWDGTYTVKIK